MLVFRQEEPERLELNLLGKRRKRKDEEEEEEGSKDEREAREKAKKGLLEILILGLNGHLGRVSR